MSKIFHPLLALIASETDRELPKYIEFLKEKRGTRSSVPGYRDQLTRDRKSANGC